MIHHFVRNIKTLSFQKYLGLDSKFGITLKSYFSNSMRGKMPQRRQRKSTTSSFIQQRPSQQLMMMKRPIGFQQQLKHQEVKVKRQQPQQSNKVAGLQQRNIKDKEPVQSQSSAPIVQQSTSLPQPTSSQYIRLSKYLSHYRSLCSRRQAQYLIQLGLVRVNGKRIFANTLVPVTAQMRAFTQSGIKKNKPTTRLWMINKPMGYICTRNDPMKRKTVYDLIPKEWSKQFGHLMTIGRLDYNSEGLLLITNDALLKDFMEKPDNDFPRRYQVKVHGRINQVKMRKMNQPITIKGVQYGPLKARIMRQLSTNVWLDVQMRTGKNREIRRIMQKCDLQVNKLIRKNYGPFSLKNLNHKEIEEMAIPPSIDRKLKKLKVKQFTGGKDFLIQVDIRGKALQIAKAQKQQTLKLKPSQKQNQKQLQRLAQSRNIVQTETKDDESESETDSE